MSEALERFRQRRLALADQLARLADLADRVGGTEVAARLRLSREQLLADSFRLMVAGEFKRGKSTLINALLGADVLPAKVAPCTARITELAWGPAPRAWVWGGPGAAAGERREVPVSQLRELLTLKLEEEDGEPVAGAEVGGAQPERVRLEWPLPLLRDGVEIVDSPGLSEHRVRTGIALGYLPQADALLMVLSCEQALSASEIGFLDAHLPARHLRHVFFLWNRYDAIWDDAGEIAAVHTRSRRHLEPRLAPDLSRVFLVAARPALLARKQGAGANPGADARLERSGLPAFEAALTAFLAEERGPLKLEGPARLAERAGAELLGTVIPTRLALLEAPLQEIRNRYAAERPRLEALQQDRLQTLEAVRRREQALLLESSALWTTGIGRVRLALPAFIAGLDLHAWEATTAPRQAHRRMAEALQAWMTGQLSAWEQEELRPLLDRHLADLRADLDRRLSRFLAELRDVEQRLCPEVRLTLGMEGGAGGVEELTAAARLIGGLGGALLGPGAAVEGATHGPSQVLRGAGWHAMLGLGLILAGAGTPLLLGASLLLGAGRTMRASLTATDDLRRALERACLGALDQEQARIGDGIRAHLSATFDALHGTLDDALQARVREVEQRILNILAEKEQREHRIADARLALDADAAAIRAILASGDSPGDAPGDSPGDSPV